MVIKQKIKFGWEKLDFIEKCQIRTWRSKVIGGWLVRSESWDECTGQAESMVFISDPNWEWEIDND